MSLFKKYCFWIFMCFCIGLVEATIVISFSDFIGMKIYEPINTQWFKVALLFLVSGFPGMILAKR